MPINVNNLKLLWISVFIIVLDLGTKYIIVSNFELGEFINVLPCFNLRYVTNTGAAFSFMSEHGIAKHIFNILAFVVSLVLIFWLSKTPHTNKFLRLSYVFIIGGALGNMFDRFYHGFVVDFLDFYILLNNRYMHYPTFNIADTAICLGATFLVIDALFISSKKKSQLNN